MSQSIFSTQTKIITESGSDAKPNIIPAYASNSNVFWGKEDIIKLLEEKDSAANDALLRGAYKVKIDTIGSKVKLTGVIEYSNICTKNCYYCGLRQANSAVERYELSEKQVFEPAEFAWKSGYGSLLIRAGERCSKRYLNKITKLIKGVNELTKGELKIILSMGEQTRDTFREWFDAGAAGYILRIETSNPDLYARIHPKNMHHLWERRVRAIHDLKEIGFYTGTGIMVGLPYQTTEDLAADILFMKKLGVNLLGMGPFLRHTDTPLGRIATQNNSLETTLRMIAISRYMMPYSDIMAKTSMQVADPFGREKAVLAGANIIMPNITISEVRKNYQFYDNRPGANEDAMISISKLEHNLELMGIEKD